MNLDLVVVANPLLGPNCCVVPPLTTTALSCCFELTYLSTALCLQCRGRNVNSYLPELGNQLPC